MKKTITSMLFLGLAATFVACQGDGKASSNDSGDNTVVETPVSTGQNEYALMGAEVEYADRYNAPWSAPSAFPEIGTSQDPLYNYEAPITPMCYTKHETHYNPCYVCHQDATWENKVNTRANYMNDKDLQNEYAFSDMGQTNRWSNLFWDKSARVAAISDDTMLNYVKTENYTALLTLLEDNSYRGFIPDLTDLHLGAAAFDEEGFAKDNSGWVAFNYKPMPSTFWPVNGSTDDVMVRMAKKYRQSAEGNYSRTAYQFNLAILEAAMKNLATITVPELDERLVGVDLSGDGLQGVVSEIIRPSYYVGGGSDTKVEVGMYPRYTEFLHTVRYIGVDDNDTIYNAPHMKELRYMIKVNSYDQELSALTRSGLAKLYDDEQKDKEEGNLPIYASAGEKGIYNKHGWYVQGFIEAANGDLRPQSYEETFYCMGCHTTIGSTVDKTFAFARKIDGASGWGYVDLKKMIDVPNRGESEGEILTYFKRVGGGNEFRIHNDVNEKFFDNGEVNVTKVQAAQTVYDLIMPSRASALKMSKAYKVIVEDQKFLHGRDGNTEPVVNVYNGVDDATPTLAESKQYFWDIRLDWSSQLAQ